MNGFPVDNKLTWNLIIIEQITQRIISFKSNNFSLKNIALESKTLTKRTVLVLIKILMVSNHLQNLGTSISRILRLLYLQDIKHFTKEMIER